MDENEVKTEDFDNQTFDDSYVKSEVDETEPLDIEDEKPHSCSTCGKRFRKLNNLQSHVSSVHEKKKRVGKIWKCSVCDESFSRNKTLTTHMAEVHDIKRKTIWNCSLCEETFSKNKDLEFHRKTVHKIEVVYECPLCNKKSESDIKERKHLTLKHPEVEKPFECPTCKVLFKLRKSLNYHIANVHELKKPHLCPYCGKGFGFANALKRHIDAAHEKKTFQCEVCHEEFKTLYFYKTHKVEITLYLDRTLNLPKFVQDLELFNSTQLRPAIFRS